MATVNHIKDSQSYSNHYKQANTYFNVITQNTKPAALRDAQCERREQLINNVVINDQDTTQLIYEVPAGLNLMINPVMIFKIQLNNSNALGPSGSLNCIKTQTIRSGARVVSSFKYAPVAKYLMDTCSDAEKYAEIKEIIGCSQNTANAEIELIVPLIVPWSKFGNTNYRTPGYLKTSQINSNTLHFELELNALNAYCTGSQTSASANACTSAKIVYWTYHTSEDLIAKEKATPYDIFTNEYRVYENQTLTAGQDNTIDVSQFNGSIKELYVSANTAAEITAKNEIKRQSMKKISANIEGQKWHNEVDSEREVKLNEFLYDRRISSDGRNSSINFSCNDRGISGFLNTRRTSKLEIVVEPAATCTADIVAVFYKRQFIKNGVLQEGQF